MPANACLIHHPHVHLRRRGVVHLRYEQPVPFKIPGGEATVHPAETRIRHRRLLSPPSGSRSTAHEYRSFRCRLRNGDGDSMFRIVTNDRSLRIIAGVCEATLAYELPNVNHQEDIYFNTYKVVTERFQYFLQDLTKDSGHHTSGIIVADRRNGFEDRNMRVRHERLVRESRKYTSTYGNFIESIFLAPSHMSVGIQFADMIAGAIWRLHEHGDERWFNAIKPAFRTDREGRIDGYGVARFPKRGWRGPVVD